MIMLQCPQSPKPRTLASKEPLHQQSKFELFMLLVHSGWEQRSLKKSDFFAAGKEKFFTVSKVLHHSYMLALLYAERCDESAGLEKIYHHQHKAYYIALISLCGLQPGLASRPDLLKQVVPNKPAKFYKQ